jgi:hypothetical protein
VESGQLGSGVKVTSLRAAISEDCTTEGLLKAVRALFPKVDELYQLVAIFQKSVEIRFTEFQMPIPVLRRMGMAIDEDEGACTALPAVQFAVKKKRKDRMEEEEDSEDAVVSVKLEIEYAGKRSIESIESHEELKKSRVTVTNATRILDVIKRATAEMGPEAYTSHVLFAKMGKAHVELDIEKTIGYYFDPLYVLLPEVRMTLRRSLTTRHAPLKGVGRVVTVPPRNKSLQNTDALIRSIQNERDLMLSQQQQPTSDSDESLNKLSIQTDVDPEMDSAALRSNMKTGAKANRASLASMSTAFTLGRSEWDVDADGGETGSSSTYEDILSFYVPPVTPNSPDALSAILRLEELAAELSESDEEDVEEQLEEEGETGQEHIRQHQDMYQSASSLWEQASHESTRPTRGESLGLAADISVHQDIKRSLDRPGNKSSEPDLSFLDAPPRFHTPPPTPHRTHTPPARMPPMGLPPKRDPTLRHQKNNSDPAPFVHPPRHVLPKHVQPEPQHPRRTLSRKGKLPSRAPNFGLPEPTFESDDFLDLLNQPYAASPTEEFAQKPSDFLPRITTSPLLSGM